MSRLVERAAMWTLAAIIAGKIIFPALQEIAETGFAPLFAVIQTMP